MYESEEIQSTPNHVEKNRKFFKYLCRKDENVALKGTLAILSQPQYKSYHYLGVMLEDLFRIQSSRSDSYSSLNQVSVSRSGNGSGRGTHISFFIALIAVCVVCCIIVSLSDELLPSLYCYWYMFIHATLYTPY